MHSFLLCSFFTLEMENIITMVSDDLFYHKIRDWIIGVQERVDEKEPLNEALYHTHMKIIISVVYDIPSTTVSINEVFIVFFL